MESSRPNGDIIWKPEEVIPTVTEHGIAEAFICLRKNSNLKPYAAEILVQNWPDIKLHHYDNASQVNNYVAGFIERRKTGISRTTMFLAEPTIKIREYTCLHVFAIPRRFFWTTAGRETLIRSVIPVLIIDSEWSHKFDINNRENERGAELVKEEAKKRGVITIESTQKKAQMALESVVESIKNGKDPRQFKTPSPLFSFPQ